ncbi:MAG: hypothetical protein J0L92_21555 [Deltaproteobacteria bacterium]|nr:hypothetical protein [Deltaproteobacteria bacterium]
MTSDVAEVWSEILDEREGWHALHLQCLFADEIRVAELAEVPERPRCASCGSSSGTSLPRSRALR